MNLYNDENARAILILCFIPAISIHSWMISSILCMFLFQFEPAPRRGEPDVTRRTPDYFLWSNQVKSFPCIPCYGLCVVVGRENMWLMLPCIDDFACETDRTFYIENPLICIWRSRHPRDTKIFNFLSPPRLLSP